MESDEKDFLTRYSKSTFVAADVGMYICCSLFCHVILDLGEHDSLRHHVNLLIQIILAFLRNFVFVLVRFYGIRLLTQELEYSLFSSSSLFSYMPSVCISPSLISSLCFRTNVNTMIDSNRFCLLLYCYKFPSCAISIVFSEILTSSYTALNYAFICGIFILQFT